MSKKYIIIFFTVFIVAFFLLLFGVLFFKNNKKESQDLKPTVDNVTSPSIKTEDSPFADNNNQLDIADKSVDQDSVAKPEDQFNEAEFLTAEQSLARAGIVSQPDEKSKEFVKLTDKCEKKAKVLFLSKNDLKILFENGSMTLEVNSFLGAYNTCEAVRNNSISKCNYLEKINYDEFIQCKRIFLTSRIKTTKCSIDSMDLCYEDDIFSKADCNSMCDSFVKNDLSSCDGLKGDAIQHAICSSIASKNISKCDIDYDKKIKENCYDQYYLNQTLVNKDESSLKKIINPINQSIAKAAIASNFSCDELFQKILGVEKDACIDNLLLLDKLEKKD